MGINGERVIYHDLLGLSEYPLVPITHSRSMPIYNEIPAKGYRPLDVVYYHKLFDIAPIEMILNLVQACRYAHMAFHNYDVAKLIEKIGCKQLCVEVFTMYHFHLPAQGSLEWKAARAGEEIAINGTTGGQSNIFVPTFGGSDLDTLMGFNKYQREKDLMKSRAGLVLFNGSYATQWGNMCEEITSMLSEQIFQCRSFETGSLPGLRHSDGYLMTRYSPDRIGVVRGDKLRQFMPYLHEYKFEPGESGSGADPQRLPAQDEYIALFEFKNPASRVPNDIVPKGYTSQMQLGMYTIPMCEVAIFMDAMIRKCSINDFDTSNKYDRGYHPDNLVASSVTKRPKYLGFIGFYREYVASDSTIPEHLEKQQLLATLIGSSLDLSTKIAGCRQAQHPVNRADFATYSDADFATYSSTIHLCADFGDSNKFGRILEQSIGDRFVPGGLKMYYSECLEVSENMQSPRIWLDTACGKFSQFCLFGGHEQVGIMPWKLFKLTIAPTLRMNRWMEVVQPRIMEAHAKLRNIMASENIEAAIEHEYPSKIVKSKENKGFDYFGIETSW